MTLRKVLASALLSAAIAVGIAALSQKLLRDEFGLISSGPKTIVATAEHSTGGVSVSTQQGPSTVRTYLEVDYPDEVMVGDSIDVEVTITQFRIPGARFQTQDQTSVMKPEDYLVSNSDPNPIVELKALKWPVDIELSSGSLDWTSIEQRRQLQAGLGLPTKVGWSPGTKDTGKQTIFLRMKNMIDQFDPISRIPQTFISINGAYLGAGENDEIPIRIHVLSKYGISDTLFHWMTIGGAIALFFGWAVLRGWLREVLQWAALQKKAGIQPAATNPGGTTGGGPEI